MSAFHLQCMPSKLLSMHLPGKVYTVRSRRYSSLAESYVFVLEVLVS
jgi:hypothetical protein